MKLRIFFYLGWVGAFCILSAYFLNVFAYIQANSLVYSLLNIAGAAAMLPDLATKRAMGPAFVQVIWILIGLGGLF